MEKLGTVNGPAKGPESKPLADAKATASRMQSGSRIRGQNNDSKN